MSIYDSWLVKTPIAHRGLHNSNSPENTLSAFQRAIDKGYAIEIDLRMTKDQNVVVFHDESLLRATGKDIKIEESYFDEIRDCGLFGTQERLPLFSEFLKLIDGRVPVLIEIKTHKNVGGLEAKILAELEGYNGEIAVQSFNPYIIKWFADNAPQITGGVLSADFRGDNLSILTKFLLKNLFLVKKCRARFISYRFTDLNRQTRKFHKKMPLLVYTIQNTFDLDAIKGQYDNIIFEGFEP